MGQSSLFNFEEGRRPGTEEPLQSQIDKINEEKRKTFDGLPGRVKGLFERANVLSEAKWKVTQSEAFTRGVTHFFDTNKTALERFNYQTARGNLQPELKGLSYCDDSQKNLGTIDADFSLNQRGKGKKGGQPPPPLPPPIKPGIGRQEGAAVGESSQRYPPVKERLVFNTSRDAAIAALQAINARSIRGNKEYAGRVCKSGRAFFYTEPNPGDRDSSDPGFCPPGSTPSATYHTHGAPDRRDPNRPLSDFSKGDIQIANREMLPTYMSDPYSNIKYYDPNKGKSNAAGDPREASDAGHFIRGVKAPR